MAAIVNGKKEYSLKSNGGTIELTSGERERLPPWVLCRLSQARWCFVRNAKVHRSHRRSFFGRARASHPRQPLQASSHPLFICEGRLTHPAQLHTHTRTHTHGHTQQKPGPPSYTEEGGRMHTQKKKNTKRLLGPLLTHDTCD